jgi:hypothetical protein
MPRCHESIAAIVARAADRNDPFVLQITFEPADDKIRKSVAGIFHHQKTAHSQNVAVFFYPVHLIGADGFSHLLQ